MPHGRTTRVTRTVWPGLAPPTLNGMLALPLLLLAAQVRHILGLEENGHRDHEHACADRDVDPGRWCGRPGDVVMEGSQPKILGID